MDSIDDLLRTAGLTAANDQQDTALRNVARSLAVFHRTLVAEGVPLPHALYLTTQYLHGLFASTHAGET